jgi:hypothetical protein
MGTIFSNRYADAFAKTLVIFGTIHIIGLISIAIRGDIDALNAFRILDLHVFVPPCVMAWLTSSYPLVSS